MIRTLRRLVILAALVTSSLCAQTDHPKRVPLFRPNIDYKSLGARTKRSSAVASEQRVDNTLYQVFHARTGEHQELFRIAVGWDRKDPKDPFNRTWVCGISEEGDFNGDGQPDYSWYGGDDTTVDYYLFLSGPGGYHRVDLVKTTQAAWKRRFKKVAPDLYALDSDFHIRNMYLIPSESGLSLLSQSQGTPTFTILIR
jgi:hypothetical protein